eukprot:8616518-Alexandrium_andersonii.AAC.1
MPDCGLCREYEMFLRHYEVLHPGSTLIPRFDPIEAWPDDDIFLDDYLERILDPGVPWIVKLGVAFVREDPDSPPPCFGCLDEFPYGDRIPWRPPPVLMPLLEPEQQKGLY